MQSLINAALESRWNRIQKDQNLRTPDQQVGVDFSVFEQNNTGITIRTSGNTEIPISRAAFAEALAYLIREGHLDGNRRCEIGSKHDDPGPLSLAVSAANGRPNQVVVTYALPILERMGLVAIDGNRPNATWLAP